MLNKSKGNMYPFVTHTWNTVKGKCPHDCSYCYMKRFGGQPKLHFDEKELKTDLGTGNFIFVGSSCDMWAESISQEWIFKTLIHCIKHFENKYLFQSKNPYRIYKFRSFIPENSIVGTTIESSRYHPQMGTAPAIPKRARYMNELAKDGFETMVTIEPIMNFGIDALSALVALCRPKWVNIGADSCSHKLPEPEPEKVLELIAELSKFTEVKIKKNLKRIIGNETP